MKSPIASACLATFAVTLMGMATPTAMAQDTTPLSPQVKYKAAAWFQLGRVMHSTDSLENGGSPNNMNGNWIEAVGLVLGSTAKISDYWEGAMGMGVLQAHNARGDISVANNWYPTWGTFVSEARISYARPLEENRALQIHLGYFPYNYNPEVKDLGLYLLRGPVYPGTPISGFEARHTTSAANIFGGMVGLSQGSLKNDLLLLSETDGRPYFDFSLADILTWQATPALQLGAGVNFYRLFPRVREQNNPKRDCKNTMSTYSQIDPEESEVCLILDTVGVDPASGAAKVDTVLGSISGTKVMARFRLDAKQLFAWEGLGKQDWVLYGEVALLGTQNYAKYYDKPLRRLPVMLGLNLPAWGWLDKFSLEVEYYASKNMSDYGKMETSYSWVPRTVPNINNARDDWKWALYFSKVVQGHLRISGQVANDHLRMFGPPDIGFISYAETLTTPKDWYWMLKATYFL